MGNAGESAEECMASFCEFELGYGHVAFQVVSRDNPAKFKEQYEVHVSGRLLLNVSFCAESKAYLVLWIYTLSSQDILEKLTLCETLDIRTRITGTASGISWSTTSRDTAKEKPFQEKQSTIHRFEPTARHESFNPGI